MEVKAKFSPAGIMPSFDCSSIHFALTLHSSEAIDQRPYFAGYLLITEPFCGSMA
jgi:hypothetical protein